MNIRRAAAALTTATALSVTGVAMATPASAQPLFTGGLVNVNVQDVEIIDDVTVVVTDNEVLSRNNVGIGVAAGVAANVCNIAVGVIARDVARGNDFACESEAGDQLVSIPATQ